MRICAFVTSILITVISTAQTPLIEELQLARKHFELSDFEQARIHFESLEIYSPLEMEDIRRLAKSYEGVGDHDEAIYRWQQVADSEEANNVDLLNLAHLLKMEARYDEAIEIFRRYEANDGEMASHFIESCEFAQAVLDAEVRCDLENMELNTSGAESGISFYKGDMVYATHRADLSSRFGIKGGSDNRPKAVLLSAEDNGNPLRIADRDGDNFGFVSYSGNGRMMVYVKSDFRAQASGVDDAHNGMALYYARTTEEGVWEEDKAFPFNSTEYDNGFPFVSEDGNTLFYASDMPGGYGGYDLYVSKFKNGSWSIPVSLGSEVNTPGNEITPFLTEGKLYFASDWLPGLGGYDVYSIKNVNNQWQELAHMGACVNSPSDDFGFVVDPGQKSAYFTSTRLGGKGNDDLYKIGDVNSISEIDLVSTESMGLPIIRRVEGNKNIEPAENINYVSESDLKGGGEIHLVVNDAGDVDKVEASLMKMRQLMHHKLEVEKPRMRSNDLPDLNFEVEQEDNLGGEAPSIPSAPRTPMVVDKVQITKDVQIKGVDRDEMIKSLPQLTKLEIEVPEEELEIEVEDTDHAINNEEVLAFSDTEIIELDELPAATVENDNASEAIDLSRYMILDDPFITNMILAPQEKVYFIQIAALKSYTSNLDRFEHFRRYGNVYKVKTGGMVKIRIGYFKTQEEAVSVLEDLKKRGIREAFVVGDILDADRMDLLASPLDIEEGEVVNLSNGDLVPSYISKYKVRVASYQWPSQFQTSQIADLGHIEHWTKGPWKIILLSGYSTKGQAKDVLESCIQRGFSDAYMVKDQNGTLQKVD